MQWTVPGCTGYLPAVGDRHSVRLSWGCLFISKVVFDQPFPHSPGQSSRPPTKQNKVQRSGVDETCRSSKWKGQQTVECCVVAVSEQH